MYFGLTPDEFSQNSSGYPVTTMRAVADFARIAPTTFAMLALKASEFAMAAPAAIFEEQLEVTRTKQFCITSANPTSLPPTVTVTMLASAGMPPICVSTADVFAPEQARNATSRLSVSASSSFG